MSKAKLPEIEIGPNKVILFISDVHLHEQSNERMKALLELLTVYEDALAGLFILGDLFNFWYGYRHVVFSAFIPVLCQLKVITDKGIPIVYITGNHDFNLGSNFEDTLDVSIVKKPQVFTINGKHIYCSHGDEYDWHFGYRLLYRIIHNKLIQKIFYTIHPDVAWWIASRFSSLSHQTRGETPRITKADVENYLAKNLPDDVSLVISGHTHKAEMTELRLPRTVLYCNLGEFIQEMTYATLDSDLNLQLLRWEGKPIKKFTTADEETTKKEEN